VPFGYRNQFSQQARCSSRIPVSAPYRESGEDDLLISELFFDAIVGELEGEPYETKYYLLLQLASLFAFLLKCERKYLQTGLDDMHDRTEWNTAIQFRNTDRPEFQQGQKRGVLRRSA
jgi:hypothetical protein